jgi:hypothetical protein
MKATGLTRKSCREPLNMVMVGSDWESTWRVAACGKGGRGGGREEDKWHGAC